MQLLGAWTATRVCSTDPQLPAHYSSGRYLLSVKPALGTCTVAAARGMTARGLLQIDAHRQHCRHNSLIGSQTDQALSSAWLPRGHAQPTCRAQGADTLRSRLYTCFRHAYLVRPCRLLYTCLWHENTHSDACPRGQQQPHPGNRAPGLPPLHRQLARTRPSMPGLGCARARRPLNTGGCASGATPPHHAATTASHHHWCRAAA